jgi:hypothetical protein
MVPEHPGFDEHLWITTGPTTLYLLFLGRIGLSAAIDDGAVAVDGPGPGTATLVPAAALSGRGQAQDRGLSRQNSLPSGSRRTCQRPPA